MPLSLPCSAFIWPTSRDFTPSPHCISFFRITLPTVRQAPREIPEVPIYRQAFAQMMMAGFLPFSAIYIELYYVFASVWGTSSPPLSFFFFFFFFVFDVVVVGWCREL